MDSHIFISKKLKTTVELAPHDISPNITERLLYKLKKKLEGCCSRHGYIRPGSLSILKRSQGQMIKQHFNGHVRFMVTCLAEVCNPVQGHIIRGEIKNKNTLGFYAESSIEYVNPNGAVVTKPIIDIIIPRDTSIKADIDLDSVNIGDTIFIEVLGKRMHLNDNKISVIGRAVSQQTREQSMDEVEEDEDDVEDTAVTEDAADDVASEAASVSEGLVSDDEADVDEAGKKKDVKIVHIDDNSSSYETSDDDDDEDDDEDEDDEPEDEEEVTEGEEETDDD